jgi:virginiamycin B lyase
MKSATTVFVLIAVLPLALQAQQAPGSISEWQVPWAGTRPRDPYAAPDGRVWFVGQAGNYLAVLDPRTGAFKRYEIDEGTFPHNCIVGKDGMVWYAGNRNGMIGRLDPTNGSVTRYPMPADDVGDPHTLIFDSKGDIWFSVQAGNAVGKLETATGTIHVVRMPQRGSRPYGIVVDENDRPWFVEFGANRVGTIDPKTMALREYTIPDPGARPRRLALSGGKVFAGDYARGKLVRLDPATGVFTEWANPGGARSAPYAMTVDDRGRIWQAETGPQPNRLVAFDPAVEVFLAPVPVSGSGGIVIRHMTFDPRAQSIWFGTDAGTIGKMLVGSAIP